jgi:hypothetical protein
MPIMRDVRARQGNGMPDDYLVYRDINGSDNTYQAQASSTPDIVNGRSFVFN